MAEPTKRDVEGHILARYGAAGLDLALFADNPGWSPEAVEHLVGQRFPLHDVARLEVYRYRVTRAWKHDGMVCVHAEPDDSGGDD